MLRPAVKMFKGSYINHVDMAGGGGLPNVHITTWALLIRIVHKGGGG